MNFLRRVTLFWVALWVLMSRISALVLTLALPAALSAAEENDRRTMAALAQRVQRPAGFPRLSAVCFSSRWRHPASAKDPHDTFQAAADFHATGFYWISGDSRAWFEEINRRGYPFQGWLSTILPDKLFGNTRQKGRILDAKGNLVTGPWMLAFQGWWGCMNSPEYRAVYLDYVKMYIDAGADSLQMDDPGENYTAVQWGGCYCPHCKEKAARLGKSPPEIQKESTEEFYRWICREIDVYAKRHVPFSCNSRPGDKYFFDFAFDFGLAELADGHARPEALYRAVRDAEQRGKAQMFTYVSRSLARTRAAIALAYACGAQIIVPWDVYIATGAPRYFGKPEEYADLYGFPRAAARYLDGYEDAAVLFPQAGDARYEHLPVGVRGGSDGLSLFVRAMPGQADAPVVIHCVDSSRQPQPFALGIDPARFFGDRPVTIDFVSPAPYERAVHQKAERTKDFGPLAITRRLTAGYVTGCDVPAVRPWGLVVISPDRRATRAVWPPAVLADDASRYTSRLRVRMPCAMPGAVVRYTLNGSEPKADSQVYERPVAVTVAITVKARAFVEGQASTTSTATFRPVSSPRKPSLPNAAPGLCLWLKGDELAGKHKSGEAIARWPAAIGPAMQTEKVKLTDGQMASAPTLAHQAIHGMPAVRFANGTDLLAIRGFANQHLTRGFTVLMVTRSDDPYFGVCGNAVNGNGGIPRLYLTRNGLTYNAATLHGGATRGQPALLTYTHDGADAVSVYVNGSCSGTDRGEQFAPVTQFGGGNFAIPFWSGNTYHPGDVAEVIVFSRRLNDEERAGIEQYLSEKYRLRTVRLWE